MLMLTLFALCCLFFFLFSIFLRLLRLLLLTGKRKMISIVVISLLALLASADNKKLSNHATTLADNSANLAFRYPQKLFFYICKHHSKRLYLTKLYVFNFKINSAPL